MDISKFYSYFELLLTYKVIHVLLLVSLFYLVGESHILANGVHEGQNLTISDQTFSGNQTMQVLPQIQTEKQLQTYENSSLGIRIQYPAEWKIDPPDDLLPTRTYFYVPLSTESANPSLNVDVFKDMGLDELKHMVEPLASDLDGPVQSYPIEFKGNPAHVFYFNWSASYENHMMSDPNAAPEKMTNFEVLTSKDNNTYLLVYSAKREGNNNNSPFNQFFPIAQGTMFSFDITKPPNQNIPKDIIAPFCRYTPGSCI